MKTSRGRTSIPATRHESLWEKYLSRRLVPAITRLQVVFLGVLLTTFAMAEPFAAAQANHPPISHAGDDQTVEGGAAVTLDGTHSWDADSDPLTYAWVQTEGPTVTLDVSTPSSPAFAAPTPGADGVPAENQALAFRLTVFDGIAGSDESEVRIMVLKPFDPATDGVGAPCQAVVTNSLVFDSGGNYPVGSLGYAMRCARDNPGTRVTFDIPASDPSYNAAGGFWQMPHSGNGSIPPLARFTAPGVRGITIDGFSQKVNRAAAGEFVNPDGPAIFLPGVILDIGCGCGSEAGAIPAERVVVRGLAMEMAVWNGIDVVMSGNYHNVLPNGTAIARGYLAHVGFSGGGTSCGRVFIFGGRNIRFGGSTPEERNLVGPGCADMSVSPIFDLENVLIVGNYYGLDRTGTISLAAAGSYGGLSASGHGVGKLDIRIGNGTRASRNVFSGYSASNTAAQVSLNAPDDRAVIMGNYFGPDPSGTSVPSDQNRTGLALTLRNVVDEGGEFILGGPAPGAGNLISGNTAVGLNLNHGGTLPLPWRFRIQGNRIGTTADGMAALPNPTGISGPILSLDAMVGGTGPGEGNVISGNTGPGLITCGFASQQQYAPPTPWAAIFGNFIGVAADGVTPLGNGQAGINCVYGYMGLSVGGIAEGEGNIIAYNGGAGYSTGNCCKQETRFATIRGNSIFANDALGITLRGNPAPLVNNAGDANDLSAANEGRNYPVLFSVTSSAGSTTITGELDTLADLGVTLDFYANDAPDPSGHGEGQRYIGSHSFTTPATYTGPVGFAVVLPATLGPTEVVTATTTDERDNTSEFSRYVDVTRLSELNVGKLVVNDDGGTAAVDDFTLLIDGSPAAWGSVIVLDPGTYTLTEAGPGGYAATFGGDCNPDGTVTIADGEAASCTVINDDIAPTLTVTKIIINDDGGTATIADFTLLIDGSPAAWGSTVTLGIGAHTIAESGVSGYAATFTGDCSTDGSATLVLGDTATCTITNDDIAPTLTVSKVIINDDGGTATVGDFTLLIDGNPAAWDAPVMLIAGAHAIGETGLPGYAVTFGGVCNPDGSLTLALGETATCTVTNDDIAPTLTVTKVVINDNGGTATADDFTLLVDGSPAAWGSTLTLDAGTHTISEGGLSGYSSTLTGNCTVDGTVVLALGDTATCTVTNDDIAPTLTVTKVVINDNGGTATADDFTLLVDGSPAAWGSTLTLDAGTHTISEDGPSGYAATFTGDCMLDGTVTLAVGQTLNCTITNDDVQTANALTGRITGGGRVDSNAQPNAGRGRGGQAAIHTTHGFTLWVSSDGSANGNLEFNDHRNGDVFHATAIMSLTFVDDPAIDAGQPRTEIDTAIVSGIGRMNGTDGTAFTAVITDAGEPGRNDFFSITFGGTSDPRIAGTLENGNHQAHTED